MCLKSLKWKDKHDGTPPCLQLTLQPLCLSLHYSCHWQNHHSPYCLHHRQNLRPTCIADPQNLPCCFLMNNSILGVSKNEIQFKKLNHCGIVGGFLMHCLRIIHCIIICLGLVKCSEMESTLAVVAVSNKCVQIKGCSLQHWSRRKRDSDPNGDGWSGLETKLLSWEGKGREVETGGWTTLEPNLLLSLSQEQNP